ncbi:DUF4333 domain-containing protein [Nocardioides sp. SYSU DS0663]|uniref:DUF4333 domain-containing protein n=1 Tax=Nocardioides sp. SYSU DS0663 TaxID=3416445 RepID=UPI003F4C8E7F
MRAPILLALAVGLGLPVAGCAEDRALSADRLEDEVAALYPAGDAGARVRVRCDDGLEASEGATSDCRVDVGDERAMVRATVTASGDEGPRFEVVPFVPAERLARELLGILVEEEYVVGEVLCLGDLLGRPDESVTCTAEPPAGGRRTIVEAEVASVRGLDVSVRYRGVE